MNADLAKEALEILKGTKGFVLDQAPDSMRQVLAWQMGESIFFFVVGLALLSVTAVCFKKFKDFASRGDEVAPVFVGIMSSVLGLIFTCHSFLDILKIHLAPKVFLMEYFSGLLK